MEVTLRIPGPQPLHAGARAVSVQEYLGNANTSFQFVGLDAAEVERMELFVFDALLEQLKDW